MKIQKLSNTFVVKGQDSVEGVCTIPIVVELVVLERLHLLLWCTLVKWLI